MTQPSPSVTYLPGRWTALAGPDVWLLADLDPSSPILIACWESVERGGGVDGLLGVILREGLRSVPSFALVGRTAEGLRLLVSGKAQAEATAPAGGEPVVVSAAGAPTWTEQRFAADHEIRLSCADAPGEPSDASPASAIALPLLGGAVLASAVLVGGGASFAAELRPAVGPVAVSPAAVDLAKGSDEKPGGATEDFDPAEVAARAARAAGPMPAADPPVGQPVAAAPINQPPPASPDTLAGVLDEHSSQDAAPAEESADVPNDGDEPDPDAAPRRNFDHLFGQTGDLFEEADSPAAPAAQRHLAAVNDADPSPAIRSDDAASVDAPGEQSAAAPGPVAADVEPARPAHVVRPADPQAVRPTHRNPGASQAPPAAPAGPASAPVPPQAGQVIDALPWQLPDVLPGVGADQEQGEVRAPDDAGYPGEPSPPAYVPMGQPQQGYGPAGYEPQLSPPHNVSEDFAPPGHIPPPPYAEPGGGPMVHAVLCPHQHLNPPYAATCRVCAAPVAQQEPFAAQRPALGILNMSTGDMVPLDRDVVLGRAPVLPDRQAEDASARPHLVQLASPANDISRSHVRVAIEGWHVQVTDLGSTNGTVVTVPGQAPVRLRPHDPFTIIPDTTITIADEVNVRFEVPA